jgi:predicted Zn-dependent protease
MLRSFAEKRPQDPFARYALAMELKATGDTSGARQAFSALLVDHPDYLAAYAPAGELLAGLDRLEEAKAVLSKGIEACSRKNDAHMRDHLEDLLAGLGSDT